MCSADDAKSSMQYIRHGAFNNYKPMYDKALAGIGYSSANYRRMQ